MKRRFHPYVWAVMLSVLLVLPFQGAAAADANDEAAQLLLNKFGGPIRDFDAARVIWETADNKVLWLYNRADGSQMKVYDAAGTSDIIREAKLSAEGVVYELNTDPSTDIWPRLQSVYSWKNGQAEPIANGEQLFAVRGNGNFAVLTRHTVDLTTGQSREPGYDKTDITADKTVIYTAPSAPVNALALYEALPDGTVTKLASPSAKVQQWNGWTLGYYGPLTDGNNIVYRELVVQNNYSEMKWALRLRSADQTVTTLAVNPWAKGNYYVPDSDYRINNGWVAYTEYNKEQNSWVVNVRSPQGTVKQVFDCPAGWSFYTTPLSINELGPDGTVAFTYNDKSYLHFTSAGKTVAISRSPSVFKYREQELPGPGGTTYRLVAWYRVAGDSLYAVRY
ncbi:hypothetical protein [Paenibacillus humicola]|uniref:hypothetical protein n=1 Tax=Paenibacillus humicola TaxID=3110540 RepID=UPI00237B96B6|nr:hypothetical protein [Paenibacillus humicola]